VKRYTLQNLREAMRDIALVESSTERIEATGNTLDEAILEAAKKAGTSPETLEYEIVDRGAKGVAGIGTFQYRILAKINNELQNSHSEYKEKEEILDGSYRIRMTAGKVYLKIIPPKKGGRSVSVYEIIEVLRGRTKAKFDRKKVDSIVNKEGNKFEFLAYFENDPTQDASAKCSISPDEMSASIILFPPGMDGIDITSRMIQSHLNNEGLYDNIAEEKIKDLVDNPVYYEPTVVISGKPPRNGETARIKCHFEISPPEYVLRADKDVFDTREFANIQNVKKGDVIAEKVPLTLGTPGITVTGKSVQATDGADKTLLVGANVTLSDDETKAIAAIDGLARMSGDRVVVDPVYTVNGDAGLKTGSIKFVGSVVVKGNVEDYGEIYADGDINILGTVGNAKLKALGNIYVRRGISGGVDCQVTSGESIVSRFVENCQVMVEKFLIVSDGIVNSEVVSLESIVCRGKRASIVGGSLSAANALDTKTLGSVSGSRTMVEVGIDPRLRLEEKRLSQLVQDASKKIQSLKDMVRLLERRVHQERSMNKKPEELKDVLLELKIAIEQLNEHMAERRENEYKLEAIRTELESQERKGSVNVYRWVYPGVTISVCGESFKLQQEMMFKTFVYRDGIVSVQPYEDPKIEGAKNK